MTTEPTEDERAEARVEGIEAIAQVLRGFDWGNYGLDPVRYVLDHYPDQQEWVADLAEKLFEQQPAYCPYDCSGCHDRDSCPCPDCDD